MDAETRSLNLQEIGSSVVFSGAPQRPGQNYNSTSVLDVTITLGAVVLALALAAATLRRRTA